MTSTNSEGLFLRIIPSKPPLVHPASVAYQASWKNWITIECLNPACKQQWHAPAHATTGEPDIAACGMDIILCPHCNTKSFLYPDSKGFTT